MDSNIIVQGIRILVLLCIAILVTITISGTISPGVKAPLLTMMGSATIIVALYLIDPRAVTWQNIGTILGTTIVMSGGGYWLVDAASRSSDYDRQLSSLLAALLVLSLLVYVFLSMIIPVVAMVIARIRSN